MGPEAKSPTDGQSLIQNLKDSGWVKPDFGFDLGRQTQAIDVLKEDKRLLFYPTTPTDSESYRLLVDNKLPVFPIIDPPIIVPEGITTIELPPIVRALDGLEFPDQEPKPGYFGSFEMMDAIAHLLTRIYKKTGTQPDNLKLNKLAMEVGNKDTIRLIPPLNLVPQADWAKVINDLKEDLDIQNPQYNHKGQIEYLRERIAHFLKNDNR